MTKIPKEWHDEREKIISELEEEIDLHELLLEYDDWDEEAELVAHLREMSALTLQLSQQIQDLAEIVVSLSNRITALEEAIFEMEDEDVIYN